MINFNFYDVYQPTFNACQAQKVIENKCKDFFDAQENLMNDPNNSEKLANLAELEIEMSMVYRAKKALDYALLTALQQIYSDISQNANKQSLNLMATNGLKDICYSLSKILEKDGDVNSFILKTILAKYEKYFNSNKYVKKQIQRLKDIVDAHEDNLEIIAKPFFLRDCDKDIAIASLVKLIEDYKTNRKQKVHNNSNSPNIFSKIWTTVLSVYGLQDESKKPASDSGKTKRFTGPTALTFFQHSVDDKFNACNGLLFALQNSFEVSQKNIKILKNGELGERLTNFIKQGSANPIVDCEVRSIDAFFTAFNKKFEPTNETVFELNEF